MSVAPGRLLPHAVAGLALASVAAAAACGASPGPSRAPSVSATPARVAAPSNALRRDYVGSAACRGCHEKEYTAWASSPMHRMTRDAATADVRAPFDGSALRFKDDVVTLESHDRDRFVRITRGGGGGDEVYRVTRVIGGRQREDFAGVRVRDVRGPAGGGGARDAGAGDELVLPVSYLIFSGSLRYKGYSVLVHERASAHAGPVWNQTCIFCHNTVPFFSTVLGALAGPSAPRYQGEVVDALLPATRRWTWAVGDGRALRAALDDEMAHLGARPLGDGTAPARALREAIVATRARFTGDDVVETGIGCETCHNGARAHVESSAVLPGFAPETPLLAQTRLPARDPAAARAQAIDRVCARCHQVLFSRYPWTWEGRRRHDAEPGGSTINSGEGRDFLLGGCASALACTACHDPHDARDRRARDEALALPAGNAACTRCHTGLAGPTALKAHAHHDPTGAGAACVACHMPRKNMGLDTTLTRYHRIGSPTDPDRVLRDRPLECALCHEGASIESLVVSMERWWNKAYPRQELSRLYGDLGARTLVATLERGKPHEQAVAAAVLGERHARAAGPLIARQLVNEYPLVRAFAARALTGAIGKDCAIDVSADTARIEESARACLTSVGLTDAPWAPVTPPGPGSETEVPED
jgi:hypothetical protein